MFYYTFELETFEFKKMVTVVICVVYFMVPGLNVI